MSGFDAKKFVADAWITGADLDQGNTSLEHVENTVSSAYRAGLLRAAEIVEARRKLWDALANSSAAGICAESLEDECMDIIAAIEREANEGEKP